MNTISIVVKDDGTIILDFGGFKGECCFEDASRLNGSLAKLGVKMGAEKITCKLPQEPAQAVPTNIRA